MRLLLMWVVGCCVGFGVASAQKLESFRSETSSQASSAKKKSAERSSYRSYDRDDDDSFGEKIAGRLLEPLGRFIVSLPARGGEASWARARATPQEEITLAGGAKLRGRKPGEMLVPMVRLDAGYHRVDDTTDALDLRAEAGFGPLALEWRRTAFTEELDAGGEDSLALNQYFAKWRMTFDEGWEVGLGLGVGSTDAEDAENDFAYQFGLRYMDESRIGGEWRRAWIETDGRTIQDNDLALLLGTDHIALRAGYRWLDAGRANLDGPHVGIALAW